MDENEDQSPFGRGFVAACVVLTAILACGAVLIVTGSSSDPANASSTNPNVLGPPTSGPATPGQSAGTGATSGSGSVSTSTASAGGQAGCKLPDGEQSVPAVPPAVDAWEVNRRVVVPRSAAFGPGSVDSDGFRRCFAHSPTGAVYAAYNAIAALADQRKAVATVAKLMVPGRHTDALLKQLKADRPDDRSAPTQLAGYRLLDTSPDRATVMLAFPVQTAYMSATLTLTWQAGDWRVVPPPPGQPVGAPYSQHRDLDEFVAWSGV
ncbi:hypothetical protein GCM10009789_15610 [Kribbella sancticallisti]|uniref:DUF8175 domain-containing protein n=1 Tax=Kribbella sancticallisti TaxID=460087 RepID=A0ABN2CU57_9ACTN